MKSLIGQRKKLAQPCFSCHREISRSAFSNYFNVQTFLHGDIVQIYKGGFKIKGFLCLKKITRIKLTTLCTIHVTFQITFVHEIHIALSTFGRQCCRQRKGKVFE